MSADADGGVPTVECRVCRTGVPAGVFCGLCGAHLTPRRGDGPDWLRLREFAAAPGEHLLRPAVASTLFPHLPHRSRNPFRVALLLVVVALVAFALLRLPAALIAVSALGLPVLFLLYLSESDARADLSTGVLVLTAVLGLGLGVGWVLLTGAVIARSYDAPLGVAVTGTEWLTDGLALPLAGVALMVTPAVVLRLLRPTTREALDGFMIGALGALAFTAAATLTRLAPQFADGTVVRSRPMDGLVVEAGIRGVAVPLTAAAAGGLIGAALWFRRPPGKADQRPGTARLVLVLFPVAVAVAYIATGITDEVRIPQVAQLVLYLLVAVVAVVVLRIGLQLALLHEEHDEIVGAPILCPHCGHIVPDMAFCPACGAATRAASRSSRATRREHRPVAEDAQADDP